MSRAHGQPGEEEVIAQLVLHEPQSRDRGWWDRMRDQDWSDDVAAFYARARKWLGRT